MLFKWEILFKNTRDTLFEKIFKDWNLFIETLSVLKLKKIAQDVALCICSVLDNFLNTGLFSYENSICDLYKPSFKFKLYENTCIWLDSNAF